MSGTTVSTEVWPRARPGADHHAAAYSPQSNGLAEAFVGTFKRDYVDGAELGDAESVLTQLGGWVEDYNTRRPTRRWGCGARRTTGRSSSR